MPSLTRTFGRQSTQYRSSEPLTDAAIRAHAPAIFADGAHESRSQRYAYIPTIDILAGLRKEGFEPFMVCQSRTRDASRQEHTKHMLRLRHRSQIAKAEANEIILINSHDGTSAYQMLAGTFRFVCCNGLVHGDELADIRVPHKGDVGGRVIEGAYEVLDGFERVSAGIDDMKSTALSGPEQTAFARAALTLRYDDETAAPITETQLLAERRAEDRGSDLWRTLNKVQEHLVQGGLRGRRSNGKRTTTRPINSIDSSVKLNRALWVLAEEMRRLRIQ